MDLTIWLPVLAMLLGAITHSLTDDGGASIIAHFWPGSTWRLPKTFIPVMILVCGASTDALQRYLAGTDWRHALASAIMAAIATCFGAAMNHTLTTEKAPHANDNDKTPEPKPSERVTPVEDLSKKEAA